MKMQQCNILKKFILGILTFYQKMISPLTPPVCRYTPTCSEYAYIAIERFGILKGSVLALYRILRCHPLGGWGVDPVPREFSLNPFKKMRSSEKWT